MPTLELNGKPFAEQTGTGEPVLKGNINFEGPIRINNQEVLSANGSGVAISNLSKLSLTPSSAPSSPTQGDMYLDSSDNKFKVYTGNFWTTIVSTSSSFNVEYLVIAGGGAGGMGAWTGATGESSSGGGAGGYRSNVMGENSGGGLPPELLFNVTTQTLYTVTVGAGGICPDASNSTWVTDGYNSTFGSITSVGGGAGGWKGNNHPAASNYTGENGGSGGGGSNSQGGGSGEFGQGYDGGDSNNYANAGGGGGAGGAGQSYVTSGGGGTGLISYITGIATMRAVGGNVNTGGVDGTINTGNGGGSASFGDSLNGGNGGKGIVIISYPNTYPDLASIDVSHTCRGATTVSGTTNPPAPSTARTGYKTYEFLDGDGNISW